MSNVPIPEPDFVQVHKPAFYKDIPIRLDWWSATSMHAHAAAVSAAKDAEISRLKHRIALHDPCNGRMAGEPPRYTPECVVLREDAERYRILRRGQRWSVINGIGDTLRAEQLDAAIDAARKGEA